MEGVKDARVSYPSGAASVVYDASVTSPEEFLGELTRMTGFQATVEQIIQGQALSGDGDQAEGDQGADHDHNAEDAEHRND